MSGPFTLGSSTGVTRSGENDFGYIGSAEAAAAAAAAAQAAAEAAAAAADIDAAAADADAAAASASASSASSSASSAATSYDSFDDRYLGAKSSNPTLDNDGNALAVGAIYLNTVSSEFRVYTGSGWLAVAPAAGTVIVADTVAALKAQSVPADGALTMTRGYSVAGKGEGVYRYVSGSSATADDVLVVAPDAGGGRYVLEFEGALTVHHAGALGDAVTVADAAISASDQTLTSASSTFTAADVGKYIEVSGAGAAGAVLVTTIASINSATSVELTAAASTTVSGAACTYGTDDAAAFQAAVDALPLGGTVHVPRGTYLLGSQITSGVNQFGLRVVGESQAGSILKAYHTTGSVLRLQRSFSGVSDMTIDATPARKAVAFSDTKCGIRQEPNDAASTAVAYSAFARLTIQNHPGHGLLGSSGTLASEYTQIVSQANKGHGIVFDRGKLTSRAHEGDVGIVSVRDCALYSNGGHGLAAGHPSDTVNPSTRVLIDNLDCAGNATDAAVRRSTDQVWMFGNNCSVKNSAFIGGSGAGCIWIAGVDNEAVNNRYINSSTSVTIGNIAANATQGTRVEGLTVIGMAQNPAVVVDSAATQIDVSTRRTTNITSLMTAAPSLSAQWVGQSTASRTLGGSNQLGNIYTVILSINDDTAASILMSATSQGIICVSANVSTGRAGLFHFRVDATTPTMVIIARTASVFNVTTGALTGTTGADGAVTISAHTDNNIYIENRTGSVRTYTVTFISTIGVPL